MRQALTLAGGLGIPLLLFLAQLHAVGVAGASELRIDKVAQAPAGNVRELSLDELAAFPPRLRLALQEALARGSASFPIDAESARVLAQLHVDAHGAAAFLVDGNVVVLTMLERSLTVGQWITTRAEAVACWMAAKAGGGCPA